MFSLICAWINRWVNHGEASDLRHHHAHYDVTVMEKSYPNQEMVITCHWIEIPSAVQTPCMHGVVMTWKRFPHYWPFMWQFHPSSMDSPHIMRSFVAFFVPGPNKLLNKQSNCRRFETPWRSYMANEIWYMEFIFGNVMIYLHFPPEISLNNRDSLNPSMDKWSHVY